MKCIYKYLALFLFAAGIVSCSSMYSYKNANEKAMAYSHTWNEIINKGNVALFDSAFSPNIVYDNANTHLQGIDDFKKYFEEYITGFSNRDFEILEIYSSGDRVIKRWSFTGTHTGAFAGIKPTGRKITIEGVTIATIRMGKIVAERDYLDDLGLMQKLGVIPAL
ncbi:MAG: ester cyclase [Bacteroidetes bacterium]|jgi:hypothetical protein|nr:ester cyclase [Bacteroidota bacterium]